MKKIKNQFVFVLGILMLIITATLALAHGNFTETKELIDSKISCDELTDEQLDEIGDYYMEQMHPGEAHDLMHQMHGGEDSEAVKLMHMQMAKSIYCGETDTGMGGMMGSGGMMGMMNPEMMSMMSGGMMQGTVGYGTIGKSYSRYWNFINILYAILIISLIALVIVIIIKLLKSLGNKKNKR